MPEHEFVKSLRQNMTDAESLLWRHLRAHRLGGVKFRRQQAIGPYVVDFVHFGARVVVEADGGQHNESLADKQRDSWLKAQGFRVMRFWNNDILTKTAAVLEAVMAAVAQGSEQVVPDSPSPPTPPPRGGRGARS
jgi:very-short-patch-repair endonuclease